MPNRKPNIQAARVMISSANRSIHKLFTISHPYQSLPSRSNVGKMIRWVFKYQTYTLNTFFDLKFAFKARLHFHTLRTGITLPPRFPAANHWQVCDGTAGSESSIHPHVRERPHNHHLPHHLRTTRSPPTDSFSTNQRATLIHKKGPTNERHSPDSTARADGAVAHGRDQ